MKQKIIVGATGASGMPLLAQCLKLIRESGSYESHLILTRGASLTWQQEMDEPPESAKTLAEPIPILAVPCWRFRAPPSPETAASALPPRY